MKKKTKDIIGWLWLAVLGIVGLFFSVFGMNIKVNALTDLAIFIYGLGWCFYLHSYVFVKGSKT